MEEIEAGQYFNFLLHQKSRFFSFFSFLSSSSESTIQFQATTTPGVELRILVSLYLSFENAPRGQIFIRILWTCLSFPTCARTYNQRFHGSYSQWINQLISSSPSHFAPHSATSIWNDILLRQLYIIHSFNLSNFHNQYHCNSTKIV